MSLQSEIDDLLQSRVASGDEVGVQVSVLIDGDAVVDACAGTGTGDTPVTSGDLFFAASTAKGVLSSLVHVLAARGVLEYDLPLVEVWPEFGAHGKSAVTVAHVLLHQAGVPGLPADLTTEQLCDWEHMCAVVADEQPWWAPGTAMGYHALTFGFLLGETLQRLTGTPLAALLRDEVTGPAGAADEVHFAVPADRLARVVRQHPPGEPPPQPPPDSPLARALPPGVRPDAAFADRRDVLTAQIPSMGTMSARGAAAVYAAMSRPDGLLPADRLTQVTAVAFAGRDEVMQMPTRWATGYGVDRPGRTTSRPGSTFGMVGANGSAAYADLDSGVAVAVMRNRFDPDFTTAAAVDDVVARHRPPSTKE